MAYRARIPKTITKRRRGVLTDAHPTESREKAEILAARLCELAPELCG
jgi:hypothetical protein